MDDDITPKRHSALHYICIEAQTQCINLQHAVSRLERELAEWKDRAINAETQENEFSAERDDLRAQLAEAKAQLAAAQAEIAELRKREQELRDCILVLEQDRERWVVGFDKKYAEAKALREALRNILGWRQTDLPEGDRAGRAIEYIEAIAAAALAGTAKECEGKDYNRLLGKCSEFALWLDKNQMEALAEYKQSDYHEGVSDALDGCNDKFWEIMEGDGLDDVPYAAIATEHTPECERCGGKTLLQDDLGHLVHCECARHEPEVPRLSMTREELDTFLDENHKRVDQWPNSMVQEGDAP